MNDDELREALSRVAATPPSGVRVDPHAARRAGELRRRTRTAVSTSLAFSLVILAGLGAIFFAAHRDRPATLGADGTTATPSATMSPSAVADPTFGIYFDGPVVVGRPATLIVSGGAFGQLDGVEVSWGDGSPVGTPGTTPGTTPCSSLTGPLAPDLYQRISHTYATARTYGVMVTVHPVCGAAQTQSILQAALPTAVLPRQTYGPGSALDPVSPTDPGGSTDPASASSPASGPASGPASFSGSAPAPSPVATTRSTSPGSPRPSAAAPRPSIDGSAAAP